MHTRTHSLLIFLTGLMLTAAMAAVAGCATDAAESAVTAAPADRTAPADAAPSPAPEALPQHAVDPDPRFLGSWKAQPTAEQTAALKTFAEDVLSKPASADGETGETPSGPPGDPLSILEGTMVVTDRSITLKAGSNDEVMTYQVTEKTENSLRYTVTTEGQPGGDKAPTFAVTFEDDDTIVVQPIEGQPGPALTWAREG